MVRWAASTCTILLSLALSAQALTRDSYSDSRSQWMDKNRRIWFDGAAPKLSDKEMLVNAMLTDSGMRDAADKDLAKMDTAVDLEVIKSSELFKFIKAMPKGGILHGHFDSLADLDWILDQALERADCFVYYNLENNLDPRNGELGCGLQQPWFHHLSDVKKRVPEIDQILKSMFTVSLENFENSRDAWPYFQTLFSKTRNLIFYSPVTREYLQHVFELYRKDGVHLMELRIVVSDLAFIRENSTDTITYAEVVNLVEEEIKRFQSILGPEERFDVGLILCGLKQIGLEENMGFLRDTMVLMKQFPNTILGFDTVAVEDGGFTNLQFQELFESIDSLEKEYGVCNFSLFLHSGESNSDKNENIVDALLLGGKRLKRIGHGLNLALFPLAETEVVHRGIFIEVCPISNHILGYVQNLQLHPARTYARRGVQITLSPDDPMFFGYSGVSPDVWIAIVAWDFDLHAIKQVFQNSILGSGFPESVKQIHFQQFQSSWDKFVSQHADLAEIQ